MEYDTCVLSVYGLRLADEYEGCRGNRIASNWHCVSVMTRLLSADTGQCFLLAPPGGSDVLEAPPGDCESRQHDAGTKTRLAGLDRLNQEL